MSSSRPTEVAGATGRIGSLETQCQTGADLEENADCRFVFYVNSIQDYWDDEFARRGATYSPATTNFFTSAVQTGCGGASSQVGPFYCPADLNVYLDLGFFDQLRTQFGVVGAISPRPTFSPMSTAITSRT